MKNLKQMEGLRPFFTRFGAKWRSARCYPPPLHPLIVEPFAGAAGYSTWYYHKQVLLNDVDPQIAGIWEYLISVSKADLLQLPTKVEDLTKIDLPEAAKWLLGFWVNKGVESPRNVMTKWGNDTGDAKWGSIIRSRLVNQVERIRHWESSCGIYRSCEDVVATWFIDPPYQTVGGYPFSDIDYADLADFCLSRRGQVIVCENSEANWLPFTSYRKNHGKAKMSTEAMWYRENN